MPVNDRRSDSAWPNAVNRLPQYPATLQQGQQTARIRPQQSQRVNDVRRQPANTRPAPQPMDPAHPQQTPKRPASKLVLVIIALVLSLVGAVLVAVGVFVLKDPKPKHVVWSSAGSYQVPAAADAQSSTTDIPPVSNGASVSQVQPETVDKQPTDDTPIETEPTRTEEAHGVGSNSVDSDTVELPADEDATKTPSGNNASTLEDDVTARDSNMAIAAHMPSGEDLFMPLISITTGDKTNRELEQPDVESDEKEAPTEPTDTTAGIAPVPEGETANEGVGTTAGESSTALEETEVLPEEGAESTTADAVRDIVPVPTASVPEQAPSTEPAPEAGAAFTPLEEESGFGVKQIVTLAGAMLVGIGSVLALTVGFLQHSVITALSDQFDALQGKLHQYEQDHREPTFAEKLTYAFEQIPALTLEEAKAYTKPRAASPQPAPAPRQQPAISFAEQVDAKYNQLLAQGGQMATQAMIAGAAYAGAGIDIGGCLYAYQSGQNTPYRVVGADKGWGVQYFVVGAGSSAPQLYPNPYALEQNGLANAQNLQYILNAFNITVNGSPLTPQSIGMVSSGLRLRHVAGARMDEQNVVVQKGQIEMG